MSEKRPSSANFTDLKAILDLKNPLRPKFHEFVKKKYAEETLDLYDAAVEYIKAPEDKHVELGVALVERFCLDESPQAIDLPDGIKKRMNEAYANKKFEPDTMGPLRLLALERLHTNFFIQFMNQMEKE